MKIKNFIFLIIGLIVIYMAFISKNPLVTIIGTVVISLYTIYSFIYNALRWYKNKKEINSSYIKLNTENFLLEFSSLITIYLEFKTQYITRDFYLEYTHNKIVEINNFYDFINTYDITEKILIYIIIGISVGLIISIIKKLLCRGKISSDKILLSTGELINLKDIKDIKIENSFWEFSKKISFKTDNNSFIIYIKNDLFSVVRDDLYSLINPNTLETNN